LEQDQVQLASHQRHHHHQRIQHHLRQSRRQQQLSIQLRVVFEQPMHFAEQLA
jgi:hypothetical protein